MLREINSSLIVLKYVDSYSRIEKIFFAVFFTSQTRRTYIIQWSFRKGLARFLEQTYNYEKFAGRFVVVANLPEVERAAFVSVGIVFWTNMVTESS